jgi:hypothetical protein
MTSARPEGTHSPAMVVPKFASEWSKLLPALKTGGLYKTHQQGRAVL